MCGGEFQRVARTGKDTLHDVRRFFFGNTRLPNEMELSSTTAAFRIYRIRSAFLFEAQYLYVSLSDRQWHSGFMKKTITSPLPIRLFSSRNHNRAVVSYRDVFRFVDGNRYTGCGLRRWDTHLDSSRLRSPIPIRSGKLFTDAYGPGRRAGFGDIAVRYIIITDPTAK